MSGKAGVVALVLGALALSACAPTQTHSIELDAAHVTSIDMYFYEVSGADEPVVTRTTIDDAGLIEELVDAFTDMPGSEAPDPAAEIDGARATGLEYMLDDGSTVALTQYFLDFHAVVIAFPDGEAWHTTWGVPLKDYYTEDREVTSAEASERPGSPFEGLEG
ncbi:hypothetical protein [Demequina sp. NBRC 110054]|uniref:hypothetical protein n=1 Tax=Demequina sp. NBRC 110054 TaxID=1570343 RepID=UPI001178B1B3|nr:hypothetical protein [Demequina sp. NBRC 110054]